MKLLVIDDDAQMRLIIRELMRHEGWEVIEAADGQEGLLQARAHLPDLILCDYEMGGMNGHELLAALHTDSTAAIPFILMAGATEWSGFRQTMELGADDYLPKPFDRSQLLKCVNARVRRSRLNRQQAEQKLSALRASIVDALPHSLLTPLNGIVGYTELVRSDFDSFSRDELRDMINVMHSSALSLAQLVDRFLVYNEFLLLAANPEAHRRNSTEAPLDLERTARTVAARHHREADLAFDANPDAPAIAAGHLSRIVTELIDNACKFSPPDSKIRLTAGAREGSYFLEISDEGRGLTPTQIDRVGAFMQFERRRYEQQGAGLGLAFVRLVTEINAGELAFRSEPGRGTTVSVRLPLTTA